MCVGSDAHGPYECTSSMLERVLVSRCDSSDVRNCQSNRQRDLDRIHDRNEMCDFRREEDEPLMSGVMCDCLGVCDCVRENLDPMCDSHRCVGDRKFGLVCDLHEKCSVHDLLEKCDCRDSFGFVCDSLQQEIFDPMCDSHRCVGEHESGLVCDLHEKCSVHDLHEKCDCQDSFGFVCDFLQQERLRHVAWDFGLVWTSSMQRVHDHREAPCDVMVDGLSFASAGLFVCNHVKWDFSVVCADQQESPRDCPTLTRPPIVHALSVAVLDPTVAPTRQVQHRFRMTDADQEQDQGLPDFDGDLASCDEMMSDLNLRTSERAESPPLVEEISSDDNVVPRIWIDKAEKVTKQPASLD
eukprot:2402022-Amphidinium_carterae.1